MVNQLARESRETPTTEKRNDKAHAELLDAITSAETRLGQRIDSGSTDSTSACATWNPAERPPGTMGQQPRLWEE